MDAPSSSASMAFFKQDSRDYSVMGGVLRSALKFPELQQVSDASPDWVLAIGSSEAAPETIDLIGQRQVGTEQYELWRTESGFRLTYSYAGAYDISADGTSITWYPAAEAVVELARAIVLGPVLSLMLEIRGHLCLHGSAVELEGEAIAFLGPKYHGKSTLAAALTRAGARLISDDLLAVASGFPARIRGGVPAVRLWEDAARELEISTLCDSVRSGVKTTASGFGHRIYPGTEAPLVAIYLLAPVAAETADRTCWRTRLHAAGAAVALAQQRKLPDSLVGLRGAGSQLQRAAATAETVPIFQLNLVRDFTRLGVVVETIMSWHSGGVAAAVEQDHV